MIDRTIQKNNNTIPTFQTTYRITCWFVLSATGCADLRLLARMAEKPNRRLKRFRPIRAIICFGIHTQLSNVSNVSNTATQNMYL